VERRAGRGPPGAPAGPPATSLGSRSPAAADVGAPAQCVPGGRRGLPKLRSAAWVVDCGRNRCAPPAGRDGFPARKPHGVFAGSHGRASDPPHSRAGSSQEATRRCFEIPSLTLYTQPRPLARKFRDPFGLPAAKARGCTKSHLGGATATRVISPGKKGHRAPPAAKRIRSLLAPSGVIWPARAGTVVVTCRLKWGKDDCVNLNARYSSFPNARWQASRRFRQNAPGGICRRGAGTVPDPSAGGTVPPPGSRKRDRALRAPRAAGGSAPRRRGPCRAPPRRGRGCRRGAAEGCAFPVGNPQDAGSPGRLPPRPRRVFWPRERVCRLVGEPPTSLRRLPELPKTLLWNEFLRVVSAGKPRFFFCSPGVGAPLMVFDDPTFVHENLPPRWGGKKKKKAPHTACAGCLPKHTNLPGPFAALRAPANPSHA